MDNKNIKQKRPMTLGITALAVLAGMSLTGCSKELKNAQANIDSCVTSVLNENEYVKDVLGNKVSNFEFLCADVADSNGQCSIDINGLSKAENNAKAYTTLNYLVNGDYFNDVDANSQVEIINTLATIVQNENFTSISAEKINNIKTLNNSIGDCIESPLDGFHVHNNFLYAIGNIQFDNENGIASFATKEGTKFSRTTTRVSYGIIGVINGKPQYGVVTTSQTEYETFYFDHNVYLKLTPEEMQIAQSDHSFIFDRFSSMVKNKENEKYVLQQTNVQKNKEFSATMMEDVSLEK